MKYFLLLVVTILNPLPPPPPPTHTQALEYFEMQLKPPNDEEEESIDTKKLSKLGDLPSPSSVDKKADPTAFLHDLSSFRDHPKFEITLERKFEVAELCEIFFNRFVKYAYLVLLSLHSFLVRWSFAAVAASAWAVNIPFRLGEAEKCPDDAFLHNVIPSGGCLYAYYFSLFIFALIVVTLCMFDVKEQAFVQFVLGVMRFATVMAMVIYCVVRLAEGGDACLDQLQDSNSTEPVNVATSSSVVKFDPRGWLLAVPIIVYAFTFHTGISSLTHPIKHKRFLHWLVLSIYGAALLSYASLGLIVPLWFRAATQETSTLNWVSLGLGARARG